MSGINSAIKTSAIVGEFWQRMSKGILHLYPLPAVFSPSCRTQAKPKESDGN